MQNNSGCDSIASGNGFLNNLKILVPSAVTSDATGIQ